jgi:hypothetical protein
MAIGYGFSIMPGVSSADNFSIYNFNVRQSLSALHTPLSSIHLLWTLFFLFAMFSSLKTKQVMRNLFYTLIVLLVSTTAFAQSKKISNEYKSKLGVKVGTNWSYLTGKSAGFNQNTHTGFMVGAYYAPTSNGRGFRTEIVFSRQGYSYDDGGKNTEVLNDYIYLPQLKTFTIGKVFQLQLGGQIGFLLNATKNTGSKDSSITALMNRFDYGFAGGAEIYPFKGLLIGGRYNLGLGKMYKQYDSSTPSSSPYPLPFNPETTNFKNGVVQLYIGWRF